MDTPVPTLCDEETAESNPSLAIRLVNDVDVSFVTPEEVCHNPCEFLRFLCASILVWNPIFQHMDQGGFCIILKRFLVDSDPGTSRPGLRSPDDAHR